VDEEVREKIVQAAKQVFAKWGFKKSSLAEIAKEARMGKSSIYYYFQNKEDLFRVVVLGGLNRLFEAIKEAVAKVGKPEDKLRIFVLTRMKKTKEMAGLSEALTNEYLDQFGFIDKLRRKLFQKEVDFIAEILQEGIDKGLFDVEDVSLTAYALCVSLKGLEYPWAVDRKMADMERDLDTLLRLFSRAIRK